MKHKSSPNCGGLHWLIAVLFLLTGLAAQAEEGGSVTGVVVSSWDGTPMPSVVVSIKGTTLATQTDANGRYQLNGVPPGDQTLRFSKSGFAAAVVSDVRVLTGQITTVNGNLRPEFYEMEEYEVTAEEFAEQTEKILIERQQASSLVDAIGSEQFSKLGAGDAGAIVSRVTGVSVVGGKFAVVRGLSDRYTRTLLNGLEVPSADPYHSSPHLDLFPSAMIDRIAVSKTFSPDQPAAGGGTIDVLTKAFPEKPFLKVTFGVSYNPDSNLKKNFLADPNSSVLPIGVPFGPKPLPPDLFGVTDVPDVPGNASSRETPARAEGRARQAAAVGTFLQNAGTANFAGVSKTSPLNSSVAASAGTTTSLFGNNLGIFAGMNYSRNFKLLEDAVVSRYGPNGSLISSGSELRGNIYTDYGANVNLGYDLSEYAQFGFNFMLAHSTDEEARHDSFGGGLEKWQIHFTEREILNYQISGHHKIPFLADSKIDWAVGLSDTMQNEPDHRFLTYNILENGQADFPPDRSSLPARYFREINEHALNYRVDWTLPLAFMKEDSKLKFGYFSSSTERDFKEEYFQYAATANGFDPNNPNTFLDDPAFLQYSTIYLGGIRTNYVFPRLIDAGFSHNYIASLDVAASYFMADIGVFSWLRLVAGVRREETLMTIEATTSGSSIIDQTDFLPAASAIITFPKNVSLRLSYGETISRPSFREKAPVVGYDPQINVTTFGNPDLQTTAIKSYDARLEWFPSPGDVISAGFFYKELESPIELIFLDASDQNVTWQNRITGGKVMGVEFEARKSLDFITSHLKGLTLGANITLIESETELTEVELDGKRPFDAKVSKTRPLYDQSPYIFNFDLSYDHPTSGTSLVVGANLTGERIVLVTTAGPDIYEHPPVSLDAAISQKFGKHWTARVGVKNILDPEFRQTYGPEADGNIYFSYKRGRTFTFSLTTEF